MKLPERLAFVDLETTGAAAPHDRITEIGIVRVGPEGVDEWSSLVNPGVALSAFIEQLTGITTAMVVSAPPFAALADTVRERLAGHVFIAHNARFDYGFVRGEYARLGQRFRAPLLCTVKLSRRLHPEHHKHSLDALIHRHGLDVSSRHRALGDARLIHQFWNLHADHPHLAAAVNELCVQAMLPAHLDAQLEDDLPEGRGVYAFYGATGQLLQVGRSKTLKRKVLSFFSAALPEGDARRELAAQVARVAVFALADEGQALLKEAELRAAALRPPGAD